MKKRIQDVLLLAVGWLLWCSAVLAQTTTQINSPIISAVASGDRVRITAPASIVQMRVEVYDRNGAKVWDSEIHGNVFDWQLQDGQAQRLAAADYFCVITVKNLAGRLNQRTGSIQIGEKDVHVGTADVRKLSAPQSQAIGPVEEDASWTIVNAAPNQTTTVIGHDGKDGQITRGRGAFSFQLGDFYSGNSQEQMRLTEEGSLGIGTSKPKFKLDVAGAIRARGGFVFNDGSTLNVNELGVLTRTSADGNITPNAAGAGTQGRLAKWTDNVGTLGDSVITENGGAIGIGNSNPDSLVNIQGPIPTLLGKLVVIRSTGANNGFGLQMDAVGSGNNAVGLAVNGVPKAAFSWDNSRQFLGLVNFAYSGNDFALRLNVDGSLTYHDGATSTEQFRITKNGNIGIGTNSPAYRIDVVGRARFRQNAGDNGATNSAGFWLFQNAPVSKDRAFIGMESDNTVGLYGGLGGWGLVMNTQTAKVGIGTTDPQERLHVVGNGLFSGNGSFGGAVGIGTPNPAGPLHVNVPSSGNPISAVTIDVQSFQTPANAAASYYLKVHDIGSGAVPSFLIRGDGNVGIGTSAPEQNLHVNGSEILSTGPTAGFKFRTRNSNSSSNDWVWYADDYFNDGVNEYAHLWKAGLGNAISVFHTGVVRLHYLYSPGDSYLCFNSYLTFISACSSSLRYKTNIALFSSGLEFIRQLRPITFDWKESGKRDIGFGAEDVARVDPLFVTYNDKGEVEGVKYDRLSVAFVNAFKEQQAQIERQQKQIDELKQMLMTQQTRTKPKKGTRLGR